MECCEGVQMCIDVFSPGSCLDVLYLHEQIWFDVKEEPCDELDITEVYDLLIENHAHNEVLNDVWALFPHDCTHLESLWRYDLKEYAQLEDQWDILSKGGRIIAVDPVVVSDIMPDKYDKYNWPFGAKPKATDDGCVAWRPFEEVTFQSLHGRSDEYHKGMPLRARVTFIDAMKEDVSYLRMLSHKEVRKTLVQISFLDGLPAGKKGWLRLIVRPVRIPFPKARAEEVSWLPLPLAFEQALSVSCPLVVRSQLQLQLRKLYLHNGAHLIRNKYEELLDLVCSRGFQCEGTSTMIADHRITLVVPRNRADIREISSTPGMDFYGVCELEQETELFTASMWGGGSNRNATDDLEHVVRGIMTRISDSEPKSMNHGKLMHEMVAPGWYEAFRFLIRQMIDVGLLEEHVELLSVRQDEFDEDGQRRICNLRSTYSTGEFEPGVPTFRVLHPFLVSFRARWMNKDREVERHPATEQYLEKQYDAFISYAHEDKEDFVGPLVRRLEELGVRVWYDEYALKAGDSLRQSIDHGLANSNYGVVVLSGTFLRKKWPQHELNALMSLEMEGRKVILPVWHKVTKDEFLEFCPSLLDKLAFNSSAMTIVEIASRLAEIIGLKGN